MPVDGAWIQRSCAPHARCPPMDRPAHVLTTRFAWACCLLDQSRWISLPRLTLAKLELALDPLTSH